VRGPRAARRARRRGFELLLGLLTLLLGLRTLSLLRRLRRLLHLLCGLLGGFRGLRHRFGALGLHALHVLRHLLQRLRQRVGAGGELLLLRGGARAVGARDLLVPALLLLRQLARLLREVVQVAFHCGALEQLFAAFERLAELLLPLGEVLQRVLRALGVEVLQRVPQLLQLLAQFGRERALQLLAHLGHARLKRRVGDAGGLRRPLELGKRLLRLLGLLHELLLALRDGLGLLRLLEGEVLRLLPTLRRLIAWLRARQVLRLALQLLAGLRKRVERAREGIALLALLGALFGAREDAQHEFLRARRLAARRIVGGHRPVAQRVAGLQAHLCEVERAAQERAIGVRRRQRQFVAPHRTGFAQRRDAPAFDGRGAQAVVVAYIDHHRCPQVRRGIRVGAGHRNLEHRRQVGGHRDGQHDRIARDGRAGGRRELEPVRTRLPRREHAGEKRAPSMTSACSSGPDHTAFASGVVTSPTTSSLVPAGTSTVSPEVGTGSSSRPR
jgi:hypothetical protein